MIKKLISFWVKLTREFKVTVLRYFLQFRSTEHAFMIIIAVIIGVVGGFGAIGIQYLIKQSEHLLWGIPDLQPEFLRSVPLYIKLLVPALGGFVVGLVVHYVSQEAKGHGVPEVMQAIAQNNGVIRARVAIAKLLASSFYIGAGGSVGREGPIIQIGSSIGSTVGQIFRVNPDRMKTFVACGAAAGIAAAFNAPIAGALFSMEIILGNFAVAQFSPIVISSVVATAVSRSFLGDYPAFIVPKYELLSPYELIFYAVLGVLAGLISVLYIKTLYSLEDFFDNLSWHDAIKSSIGGFLVGGMGVFIPEIYGVGYYSIGNALTGDMVWQMMLLLIFVKILATSLSLGSGGSGGVFAPSLFIGTMTGGFFGIMLNQVFPFTANPGAYALVGMGALVAGSTHAPLTAILIIFEMTNDYKIILPLMISCVISTILASKLQNESIYTLKLIRRGINLFSGRDVNVLRKLPVKSIMRDDPVIVSVNTSFPDLIELFYHSTHAQFFVVDKDERLIGRVKMDDIRQLLQQGEYLSELVIAHDLMQPNVANIHEKDTLDDVMKIFGRYTVEELPVVDSANPDKIIGVVFYKDVISAYNQQLIKQDFVRETSASINLLEKSQKVSFLGGYAMTEIQVSMNMAGKSLQQLNLRQRFGVNILMIKRNVNGEAEVHVVPNPGETIQMGDRLVAMGKEKDLEKLRHL